MSMSLQVCCFHKNTVNFGRWLTHTPVHRHDQFVVTNPLLYHRFTMIHGTAQTGLHTIIKFKIPVTSFNITLNRWFPYDISVIH